MDTVTTVIKRKIEETWLELNSFQSAADANAIIAFAKRINQANRVFAAGAGRSGLVMKMFAMRLMQAGLSVHIVGDPTTPSIKHDDILIIGSGSGSTKTMVTLAYTAQKVNAEIALITYGKGELIHLASEILHIPIFTDSSNHGGLRSVQVLGTLFDQLLLIWTGWIVESILHLNNEDSGTMQNRHANLE